MNATIVKTRRTERWLSAVAPALIGVPRLAGKSSQVIAVRVLGAGLALAGQVFASRLMGAEEFGRYALAMVYMLLLGHLGTLGTAQLVCRFLADYLERGDEARANGLLRFALCCTTAVSVATAVLALLLVHAGFSPLGSGYLLLASIMAFGIPLLALQDFLEAIARGLDRPLLGIGPAFILRHLAIILGLAGLLLVGYGASAVSVAGMTVIGLVASLTVQYALLRRHLHAALGNSPALYSIGHWTKTALPIASVDVAEVLFLNVDILILGFFLPPESVALYFAASRLAQILAYVPYGVTAVTAQKYAALFAAARQHQLQSLVSRSAAIGTGFAVAGALLLWFTGGFLLSLFGPEYVAAQSIIPILCLGIIAACLLGPGEDALTMLGQERWCSLGFVVALAVNVATALALIPTLGPVGAAIGVVAGLSVRGVLLAWFAYRRLGLLLPVFASRLMRIGREQGS